MDLLSQHEAFLRAIFDAPEDDTPRLVYADFLQENGEEDRAEFIRLSITLSRQLSLTPSREEEAAAAVVRARCEEMFRGLCASRPEQFSLLKRCVRGFPSPRRLVQWNTAERATVDELRMRTVDDTACFGAVTVKLSGPRVPNGHVFDTIFSLPAFTRITELDLSGAQEVVRGVEDSHDGLQLVGQEFVIAPVVSIFAVEALARHRGARKLLSLDLRNNNLDNDAARALVKSPYLDNLKRLQLLEGNRLRGRVWQQVIERFGEDVVG